MKFAIVEVDETKIERPLEFNEAEAYALGAKLAGLECLIHLYEVDLASLEPVRTLHPSAESAAALPTQLR